MFHDLEEGLFQEKIGLDIIMTNQNFFEFKINSVEGS